MMMMMRVKCEAVDADDECTVLKTMMRFLVRTYRTILSKQS